MSTTKTILQQFAASLSEDIKDVIPKVTGKTADSVQERVYDLGFEITANASLVALIDGRKPTSKGASSGGQTLRDSILDWIEAKGLVVEGITSESLAFLISRSIHEKGTLLYQRGGGNNLFETVINDSKIDILVAQLLNNKRIDVESEIIKGFKK